VDSKKLTLHRSVADKSSQARADSMLLRSARWIMLAIGLVIGLLQIAQHFQSGPLQANFFLFAEVFLYVVVLPLLGSALLDLLARSERRRHQAAQALTQQYALVRNLSGALEWNELVRQVVEFPHFVLPVSACGLYLYNEKSAKFDLAGFWSQGEGAPDEVDLSVTEEECQVCNTEGLPQFHRAGSSAGEAPLYSLPLCLGGKTWGLMQLRLPPRGEPTEAQEEVLNAVATDLALVLDRAILRSNALSQAAASEAVRRQIAQDLHDTLAQNIAYLRLKLEELLLEENPSRQVSLIRGDLRRMHEIADEAYTQMRDTLDNLQTGESRDLLEILQGRARAVAERDRLEVSVSQEGDPPEAVDELIKRQVVYICREALNNIERHSQATRVEICVVWQPEALIVTVMDNGVGFDPAAVDDRRHYGLMIMRERAESVGADLHFESSANRGTTVTLVAPLAEGKLEHIIAAPANGALERRGSEETGSAH
jgi:signal transduction histidine kinase